MDLWRPRASCSLSPAAFLTVVLLLAGCQQSSRPSSVATTTSRGAVGATSSTTSPVPIQTSGPRTVLSPIGLNLRAQASKTASVVGTAAQGTILTVLSHTVDDGGWYQVKGATVTGFITDNPTLSANGKLAAYSSGQHNFSSLYPQSWTTTEAPPDSVVFHPTAGGDSIVVTTGQLVRGRPGYRQVGSVVIVACGVTGDLVTFVQSAGTAGPTTAGTGPGARRYLVQLRLTLDPQHSLGVEGNLADLGQLQVVKDLVNSLSFPFPQCERGAIPEDTTTTSPTTTVP